MKEERGDEISEESLSVRRRPIEHSMLRIFGHCDEAINPGLYQAKLNRAKVVGGSRSVTGVVFVGGG